MTQTDENIWPTHHEKQRCIALAKSLRQKAKTGGLRFDAYLPPQLAEWLLERIESGRFFDPSEAVFVMLGEQKDLEPHVDLRRDLLQRTLEAVINDPRPHKPVNQVREDLRAKIASCTPPAEWPARSTPAK